MPWLSLLGGLLKLFNIVAQYAANKQMMDAGQAELVASIVSSSLERIALAKAIRSRGVDAPAPDGMRDDIFDRHNKDNQ